MISTKKEKLIINILFIILWILYCIFIQSTSLLMLITENEKVLWISNMTLRVYISIFFIFITPLIISLIKLLLYKHYKINYWSYFIIINYVNLLFIIPAIVMLFMWILWEFNI